MDWITGILTLVSMWLISERKFYGWIIGLVCQCFWFVLVCQQKLWGLMAVTIIMTIIYIRAIIKWRGNGRT